MLSTIRNFSVVLYKWIWQQCSPSARSSCWSVTQSYHNPHIIILMKWSHFEESFSHCQCLFRMMVLGTLSEDYPASRAESGAWFLQTSIYTRHAKGRVIRKRFPAMVSVSLVCFFILLDLTTRLDFIFLIVQPTGIQLYLQLCVSGEVYCRTFKQQTGVLNNKNSDIHWPSSSTDKSHCQSKKNIIGFVVVSLIFLLSYLWLEWFWVEAWSGRTHHIPQ